jgi:hypothetical protein
MIVTAGLLAAAPPANADTQYGGTASLRGRPAGPTVALVRHDDGRITGRLSVAYECKHRSFTNEIVRLKGSTADGVSFSAAGKLKWRARGTVRFALTGALAPDSVSGKLVTSLKGCPKYTRDVALRTESAPAGAPAVPAAAGLFSGLTAQAAGGIRLPVALRVTSQRRVWAVWQAQMRCGPKAVVPMGNTTPTSAIKPDGTFSRSETYTIRFRGGLSERYRVTFKGRFLADGAVGTLRARMQTRKKGKSYYPCDSGTQTWAVRP